MEEISQEDAEFIARLKKFIETVYQYPAVFAKALGISEAVISRYLSGGSMPNKKNLALFEEAGGLSVSWLLTGQGDMFSVTAKGRELRKKHVGKDLPQTVEEVLGADTKEALRRALSEVMERFTG